MDEKKKVIDKIRKSNKITNIDKKWKNDEEVMLEAVIKDGRALQFAGTKIRNNPEIVIQAVRQDGSALEFAGKDVKNVLLIVYEAVRQNGNALQFAGQIAKNDFDIVLEAVKQNGKLLEYAGSKAKNNVEIVLEAVKQNGKLLEYAGSEAKNNVEIVLEAVKQNGKLLEYAGSETKNNLKVVLEAVKQNGNALQFAGQIAKKDFDIVLEAVKQDGNALQYADKNKKKDSKIILEAVKQNGYALKYAEKELKEDSKIVLEAVKQNGRALQYASKELRYNIQIVSEAVKQNGTALQYVGEKLLIRNPEIELEAVKQDGRALQYASEKLKNDSEIALEAIMHHKDVINYIGEELKRNIEFLINATRKNSELKKTYRIGMFETSEIVNIIKKQDQFQEKYRFIPATSVVRKYPDNQIDIFNKKIWFSLARNELYNKTDDAKNALVEAILTMGAFEKDEGAKKRIGLLQKFATYVPKEIKNIKLELLTEEERKLLEENYKLVKEEIIDIEYSLNDERLLEDKNIIMLFGSKEKAIEEIGKLDRRIDKKQMEEMMKKEYKDKNYESVIKYIYKKYYKEINQETNNTYIMTTDLQKEKNKNNKEGAKLERKIKELYYMHDDSKIMTPEKIHRIFDGTDMKYKPGFFEFFENNIKEILKEPNKQSMISKIQKNWDEISQTYLGQRITFEKCENYFTSIIYKNVTEEDLEIAKLSNICKYDQGQFEEVKNIYKEQLERKKSSIPSIEGKNKKVGLTYKVLGLKDPTAIFVGELTDCCQALGNAGESCMRHSATSENGRVLVVQDEEGKILSQSWIWRNKGTLCFDNIEAVKKDSENRKVVGEDILETVKMAAEEFLKKDKETLEKWEDKEKEKIENQRENEEITQEEYDTKIKNIELIKNGQQLSKVTVGVGYTDVNLRGLKADTENIYPEENIEYVEDSRIQLVLAEDKKVKKIKTEIKTIPIYTDEEEVENLVEVDTSEIKYKEVYDEDEYEEVYYEDEYEEDDENEYDDEFNNDDEYEEEYTDEEYEYLLNFEMNNEKVLEEIKEELRRITLEEIKNQIGDRKKQDIDSVIQTMINGNEENEVNQIRT